MKALKRVAALLGMALGTAAGWLPFSFGRAFSNAPGFFQWGSWKDHAFTATLALLGLAVVAVAYCFGFRWDAESTASPNGGPTERLGDSGVTGGPPSVT